MMVATLGYQSAREIGVGSVLADEVTETLSFGSLEPLVCLMQESKPQQLLPVLVEQLRSGVELRRLVAAAALANARTFGGEDYVGFHTMMALSPAMHMSQELPKELAPLPVLKVLYRNTNRIQEHGGRTGEILHEVTPGTLSDKTPPAEFLRDQVRHKDVDGAERTLANLTKTSPEEAFNDLLYAVHDHTEVHRVVLPYRAWDLLGLVGMEQAHTLLRQSVRYCVKAESWSPHYPASNEPKILLPKLLEEFKLLDQKPGTRIAEDAWVDQMSQTIFKSTPEQAAHAAAAALAEGMAPAGIAEAITLAANQLILRDYGRTPDSEVTGKPIGSVHGDSIGVHACDSANAWRNMSRVSNARNCYASLILGSYQVALDRINRGGDFLHWEPLPLARYISEVKATTQEALLREADEAIRGNLQARATGIVHRYAELGYSERPMFDLMLRYAISEDGALHAEKFYRTASEEFNTTRPVFRWRHLKALARVTASEYGRPAAGVMEARALLKV
jgi:hypothetical protein